MLIGMAHSFAQRLRRFESGGLPGLSEGVHGVDSGPLLSDLRLVIGEALAFDALEHKGGALCVLDAEL